MGQVAPAIGVDGEGGAGGGREALRELGEVFGPDGVGGELAGQFVDARIMADQPDRIELRLDLFEVPQQPGGADQIKLSFKPNYRYARPDPGGAGDSLARPRRRRAQDQIRDVPRQLPAQFGGGAAPAAAQDPLMIFVPLGRLDGLGMADQG